MVLSYSEDISTERPKSRAERRTFLYLFEVERHARIV
jgi:hypothetical protein